MLPSHSVCSSRRIFGSRKLWESKDERKWGHDKFEEMSMQEKHYEVVCSFYSQISFILVSADGL